MYLIALFLDCVLLADIFLPIARLYDFLRFAPVGPEATRAAFSRFFSTLFSEFLLFCLLNDLFETRVKFMIS